MLRIWSPPERPESITEDIRGHSAWVERRRWEAGRFTQNHRKIGQGPGYSYAEADRAWKRARTLAEKDVSEIKNKIDLDAAAEEALVATLTVMRAPISADIQLKAARQVLDFTMAKPVAKTEVTVNTAEDWLKSISGEHE